MSHRIFLAACTAALLAACGNADDEVEAAAERTAERAEQATERAVAETREAMTDADMDDMEDLRMTADVVNASGYTIGTVTLEHSDDGVELEFDVTSLPEGTSAIHFHETGACDTPDFMSAGGHFNPSGVMHGHDSATGPHAGDMRNIEIPQSGVLKTSVSHTHATLMGHDDMPGLLDTDGSALIIHAEADDYESQPSGAAGARIACAVISR